MAMPIIQVAIVEDNTSIREGLKAILNGSPGFHCSCTCENAEQALRQIPTVWPDVVLMDIHLPRQSGIECVRQLKEKNPQLQVIMLTIEEDSRRVFESLEAGATGYLVKDVPPADILGAIEEVNRGGSPMSSPIARMLVKTFHKPQGARVPELDLTKREREVLQLVAKGFRSKEIAETLEISGQTVESHLRNIYDKLHVRSRAGAVALYLRGER